QRARAPGSAELDAATALDGLVLGGPTALSAADCQRLAAALDRSLTSMLKAKTPYEQEGPQGRWAGLSTLRLVVHLPGRLSTPDTGPVGEDIVELLSRQQALPR